ncbi:MAG TPA: PDZ domain-containing protein, partial [Pyrinomonadaceae bacterium]
VELEAFNAPPAPPSFFAQAGGQFKPEPEYLLVTSEGKRFEAKFVGLDSSTGLAMLEAGEPLLSGAPVGEMGDTDDPTVGQRVRLYAPIPAEAPVAPAAPGAPPAPPSDSRYIYLSIDQKEGRLAHLVRAPSGRLSSVVLSADVSPEWVGAVAANELGEVVGIVSQSRDGETRMVPMMTVREACERVLKLRGTVPQPWLGARGDAAAQSPLNKWVGFGWPKEFARSFIEKSQGILLDSVAPGTPAALAGLRAGDLITSVGTRTVRSGEDLSMTLKEAGVGSVVDVTVWRALSPEPLKFAVELKGVKNPAQATAEAERRALRASLLGSEQELREMRAAERSLRSQSAEARADELTLISRRIAAAEERSRRLREQFEQAQQMLVFSQKGAQVLVGPQALLGPDARARDIAVTTRLRTYGLHAIALSSRLSSGAAPLGAEGGLLVVVVQPDSQAATSGLMPGDVIETVNGSPLWRFELRRLTSEPDAEPAVLGLVRGRERLSVNFPPAQVNR